MDKKYKVVQRQIETPNLSELKYGVLHSVINSCSSRIASEREGQLIARLKECGFEFETRQELKHFAKTRCQIEVHLNKLNTLRVDEKIIAEWWDTVEIKQKSEKWTVIAGNPPSNYL
jgi:hypothetical protein